MLIETSEDGRWTAETAFSINSPRAKGSVQLGLKLIIVVRNGLQIIHSQVFLVVYVKNVFLLKIAKNLNTSVKLAKCEFDRIHCIRVKNAFCEYSGL